MMAGRRHHAVCGVADCPNPKGTEISYHRVPKKADVKAKWIVACKRAGSVNWNSALVCSTHFTEEDFVRDLRNELLGLPLWRMLKEGAVPSRQLPRHQGPTEVSTQQSEARMARRAKRESRAEVSAVWDEAETNVPEPCQVNQETQVSPAQATAAVQTDGRCVANLIQMNNNLCTKIWQQAAEIAKLRMEKRKLLTKQHKEEVV